MAMGSYTILSSLPTPKFPFKPTLAPKRVRPKSFAKNIGSVRGGARGESRLWRVDTCHRRKTDDIWLVLANAFNCYCPCYTLVHLYNLQVSRGLKIRATLKVNLGIECVIFYVKYVCFLIKSNKMLLCILWSHMRPLFPKPELWMSCESWSLEASCWKEYGVKIFYNWHEHHLEGINPSFGVLFVFSLPHTCTKCVSPFKAPSELNWTRVFLAMLYGC